MRTFLPVALSLLAFAANAERLFVGLLESDGVTSAKHAMVGFGRGANIPDLNDEVDAFLDKHVPVPYSTWLALNKPVRIALTIDPNEPLSGENPAALCLLPLLDNGERAIDACETSYRIRQKLGTWGNLFTSPVSTNLPPRFAIAKEGRTLLASTSPATLEWGWKLRSRFVNAPSQDLPGTIRILANTDRTAALLPLLLPAEWQLKEFADLLRNFQVCQISFQPAEDQLTVRMRGKPVPQSDLVEILSKWKRPGVELWKKPPEDTDAIGWALAAADCKPFLHKRLDVFEGIFTPWQNAIQETAFDNEVFSAVLPSTDRKGLVLCVFAKLKSGANIAEKLESFSKSGDVAWERQSQNNGVFTYFPSQTKTEDKAKELTAGGFAGTLLGMFLKEARLDVAEKNGWLVCVLGPRSRSSLAEAFRLLEKSNRIVSADKQFAASDSSIKAEELLTCVSFSPSRFILQSVACIPGVRRAQLDALPPSGDGFALGVARTADDTVELSMHLRTGEIASLRKLNGSARDTLMEIFFQMFTRQFGR